ncbi:MAG: DUF6438 domain-containing protein [Vicingaceae bacterium]|nr:DUF6438 domain-containing protein [Vicingaceae bacterium]
MQFVISLLIFGLISTETAIQSNKGAQEQEIQQPLPVKESLLLTLERTPCFGKCPTYKYTIFSTGMVLYNGFENVKNLGTYKAQLTKSQIEKIKVNIKSAKILSLKNKYDSQITDIPSTLLIINLDGEKKKIYDRYGAPEELTKFEKLVDDIVLNSNMTKTKDQYNGNKD